MEEVMGAFGQLLSDLRRGKGLTLRRLGGLANISPSYLSEIENGTKLPPKEDNKLENLALILGIDFQALKKKAALERDIQKSSGVFERIFGQDNDLAMSLYRQTEESSQEELEDLKDILENAIRNWKETKNK